MKTFLIHSELSTNVGDLKIFKRFELKDLVASLKTNQH